MQFQALYRWAISRKTQLIFAAILLLGVFARTWEFRSLPPGLHHDEASIGVEAYYLYHYGVDRHNESYPVHFISWGNGQNAPYAYLLIPLIALFGLSVPVIRLPILLSGIATLPFIYLIFRRTVDEKFGLFAMFCIAISPWHIILSRWGLESNLLPFFFSVGYFLLLKTSDNWRWFIPANLLFALCLYTYGISYAFLPLFLFAAVVILLRFGVLTVKQIATGLVTLFVSSLPIILFVVINLFDFNSIHIGPVTIPHMPTLSRFQQEGMMFQSNWLDTFIGYSYGLIRLLAVQDDFRARNVFPPYGYFYGVTFPLAIFGIWLLARSMQQQRVEKLLWYSWLGASMILGMLEPVIVNRINIIFIPLIGFIAYFLYWLGTRFRPVMPPIVILLLAAFSLFTYNYHGDEYRQEAGKEFYTGLLPAIQFAQENTDGPICITNYKVYMPYIFVLYTEKIPPAEFVNTVDFGVSVSPLREARQLGRYTFGLENCGEDAKSTYILFYKEKMEHPKNYTRSWFDYFIVYTPKE